MSQELKTQLIRQCEETVGNDVGGRRQLNIAVIGPAGCGKSSFLNTIFASFKNSERACWREIAKMGDYGEHDFQETSRLRIYPKQAYIEDNDNHVLMPTFLDITGLEDEESEINKEMLSILLSGKLEEGEELISVYQFFMNNGQDMHKLRQLYNKRSENENAKVDRIVVVCTANPIARLPDCLLRAIRDTAKKGSREIPVYGVLTKADKQRLNDHEYIDRQTQFRHYLGLIDTRFKCITNYCTDAEPTGSYISTTLPELDIPVLELMTQVLFPHPDDTPTPNSMKKIAFAAAIFIILLAIVLEIISKSNKNLHWNTPFC